MLFFICIASAFGAKNDENLTSILEPYRDKFTDYYCESLDKVDNYLSNSDNKKGIINPKIYKNRLDVTFSFKSVRDKIVVPSVFFRANIVLPKINNKVELVFSKQAEKELENEKIIKNHDTGLKDKKTNIGLKYSLYKDDDIDAYIKAGMRFRLDFKLYIKSEIERITKYSNFTMVSGGSEYYYLRSKEFKSSIWNNFIKQINKNILFSQKNVFYWDHKDDEKELLTILEVDHSATFQDHLTYWLAHSFTNDNLNGFSTDEYSVNIRYRYQFNKWLYFDVIPQLMKKRENHYKFESAFTFNVGISFYK